MADVSVIDMIIDQTVQKLKVALIDNVPESDPTRAGLVRGGLLQQNPAAAGVNVLVYENDPENNSEWLHSTTHYDMANGTKNPPAYELGNGFMWWRRFTIEMTMFWDRGIDRQVARSQANVVLGRIEKTIRTMKFNAIDSFGEIALQPYVMKDRITDAGGKTQFIHYGKIWWQVLTGSN
jgi:hypothetical protein